MERGSKAAKRLESGPSERELAGLVVVVVVLAELVEPMALVMHVAKRVVERLCWHGLKCLHLRWCWIGVCVCEVQKLVPVKDVLAWDVAT